MNAQTLVKKMPKQRKVAAQKLARKIAKDYGATIKRLSST
jgi:hypothetical protein